MGYETSEPTLLMPAGKWRSISNHDWGMTDYPLTVFIVGLESDKTPRLVGLDDEGGITCDYHGFGGYFLPDTHHRPQPPFTEKRVDTRLAPPKVVGITEAEGRKTCVRDDSNKEYICDAIAIAILEDASGNRYMDAFGLDGYLIGERLGARLGTWQFTDIAYPENIKRGCA